MKKEYNWSITDSKRFIDYLGIGEVCGCPFGCDTGENPVDNDHRFTDSCRQRNIFQHGNHTATAGTYGESVFICDKCWGDHGEDIKSWSKGRKDFIDTMGIEHPELLQRSMERHNFIK